MKKLMAVILLGGLLGSLAGFAQNQPGPQGNRPTPPQGAPQEWRQHQMMERQMALQQHHQMLAHQPACPLRQHVHHLLGMLMLGCLVIHILLAIWVYQDIRRRTTGSGIWIVVTLLAGLCGAAVYALVRIGEKQG